MSASQVNLASAVEHLEWLLRDVHGYDNAADVLGVVVRAAKEEGKAELVEQLKDPKFVHTNILRGAIALTPEDALHYGGHEQKCTEAVKAERDRCAGVIEHLFTQAKNDARKPLETDEFRERRAHFAAAFWTAWTFVSGGEQGER